MQVFGALVLTAVMMVCPNGPQCSVMANEDDDDDDEYRSIIDLPTKHFSYYLDMFPKAAQYWCAGRDTKCAQRLNALQDDVKRTCWGYEINCSAENRFLKPTCAEDHIGWAATKTIQEDTFFTQADFGYVRQQNYEMMVMCEPLYPADSVLECSKYARFCRGRNLRIDFENLRHNTQQFRYKTDVLSTGQIGGYCKFEQRRLDAELEHLSALQSWAPEMRNFVELPYRPIETGGQCDRIIDKPTFIMKIDAAANMYHHFCDFINLYASQHLNATHPASFSTDVNILIWETYAYDSPFAETFKAFTRHPILTLNDVRGERLCFRNVVMPLLPRMIFGLYYNTPIINGCSGSGLFQAFSEHILHRLAVPLHKKRDTRVRVTFLSRHTRFRNIINVDELIDTLRLNESYNVQKVVFERSTAFRHQLEVTRNTDIFIGMHGAGLTHLLFLPVWASLFELYNCEDASCYRDLARLRGTNYVTWEHDHLMEREDQGHHPEEGSHAKFTNYSFDKDEFVRLVGKAAEHVYQHESFQQFIQFSNDEQHQRTEL